MPPGGAEIAVFPMVLKDSGDFWCSGPPAIFFLYSLAFSLLACSFLYSLVLFFTRHEQRRKTLARSGPPRFFTHSRRQTNNHIRAPSYPGSGPQLVGTQCRRCRLVLATLYGKVSRKQLGSRRPAARIGSSLLLRVSPVLIPAAFAFSMRWRCTSGYRQFSFQSVRMPPSSFYSCVQGPAPDAIWLSKPLLPAPATVPGAFHSLTQTKGGGPFRAPPRGARNPPRLLTFPHSYHFSTYLSLSTFIITFPHSYHFFHILITFPHVITFPHFYHFSQSGGTEILDCAILILF